MPPLTNLLNAPIMPPPLSPPSGKIKILPSDINMTFLNASDRGKNYKIIYVINIITKSQKLNPNLVLRTSFIDMASLKNAIMTNVDFYDKTYLNLEKFDNTKAEFYFDHDKWLDDCLGSSTPITYYSRFNRIFKLKKRVPLMINHDYTSIPFEKFVIRKFKEYMESKKKAAVWFKHLFPDEVRSRWRAGVSRMFDYTYDMQWNTITVTLKPLYILGILYAIGSMTEKMTKRDIQGSYKRGLFAQQVKKSLKQFDRKKWDKFKRKKFLL